MSMVSSMPKIAITNLFAQIAKRYGRPDLSVARQATRRPLPKGFRCADRKHPPRVTCCRVRRSTFRQPVREVTA